jgi:pimeloyl-ACP methyl ester carboxylesterase
VGRCRVGSEHLGISQWLVFGGSWGSTLGLDYAQRYAPRCLGLIIRGIYLNTKPEFDQIYSRSPFLDNPRRLAEFDTWQELAVAEAKRNGEPPLNPDDSERFIRLYEAMILRGCAISNKTQQQWTMDNGQWTMDNELLDCEARKKE